MYDVYGLVHTRALDESFPEDHVEIQTLEDHVQVYWTPIFDEFDPTRQWMIAAEYRQRSLGVGREEYEKITLTKYPYNMHTYTITYLHT